MVHPWAVVSVLFATLIFQVSARAEKVLERWPETLDPKTRSKDWNGAGHAVELPEGFPTEKSMQFFTQDLVGDHLRIEWPVPEVKTLKYAPAGVEFSPKEHLREPPKRPEWKAGTPYNIVLAFPTLKPAKNDPLEKWFKEQIEKVLDMAQVGFPKKIEFKVRNTRLVGEQPLNTTKGAQGVTVRKEELQNYFLDPKSKDYIKEEDLPHSLWMIPLESSLTERPPLDGNNKVIGTAEYKGYDTPNVLATELYSGASVFGRGAGPRVQGPNMKNAKGEIEFDFLQLVFDRGFDDQGWERLCGQHTYGEMVEEKTGLSDDNWHLSACGYSRMAIIDDFLKGFKIPMDELKKGLGPAPYLSGDCEGTKS